MMATLLDMALLLGLKSALLAALALATLALLQRASAARRAVLAQLALLALLLLPLASVVAPAVAIDAPALMDNSPAYFLAAQREAAQSGTTPLVEVLPLLAASAPVSVGWLPLLAIAYGVVALYLLLRTALAIAGLYRLASRATPVADAHWLCALQQACARRGLRRRVRLLVSAEVAAPLSWGMLRPVIVVDPHSLARADAGHILAHELAHIARHDWPALLLQRAVCAIYWANPLVWLLARRLEQDSEQAADDRVIAAGVAAAPYAHTLLQVSVQAAVDIAGSGAPGANAIAASGALLKRRIEALLDGGRRRASLNGRQMTAALLLAGICTASLAALQPAATLLPGDKAAQQLEVLGVPNLRSLAHAMRQQNFDIRRTGAGSETFRHPDAIEPMTAALADPRATVRRLALWGLSEMRYPVTTGAVAAMLADPVPAVRAEAARALGDIGVAASAAQLVPMLKDDDAHVRRQAAHALGDLRSRAAIAALRAATRDEDGGVAAESRWALQEIE